MSKGDRKREGAALRRAEEERQRELQRKKRRRNGILTTCVAVVAVIAVGLGIFAYVDRQKKESPDYQLHHNIAASSDNFEVTQAMMTYFVRAAALNFAGQYEDYLDTMGLDLNKSLKSQTCYFNKTMSWFEYFSTGAQQTARWLLGFCEEATKNGRTLSDADKKEIEETLAKIKTDRYGEHITKDDVRACLELYFLANQQETAVQAGISISEDDIESQFAADKKAYLAADYAKFTLKYGKNRPFADKDEAKTLANKLMKATPEEFEKLVKAELLRQKVFNADTIEDGYVDDCVVKDYTYKKDDGVGDWLLTDSVKVGDTHQTETSDSLTVYIALTAPKKNDTPVVDVRHILLSADKYGSDDKAFAKATELLDQWRGGEATEEAFAKLAKEYSEDGNASEGGLYTGVVKGQMVESFDAWCMDKNRKSGDAGIVKTKFGYHIIYFVDGVPTWYVSAKQAVQDARYNAVCEGYYKTYNVKIDPSVVIKVDL